MSSPHKRLLFFLFAALVLLAGCGSPNNQAAPPPGGSFDNNNLSGTYIFSFSGYDVGYGNGTFFAVVGSLTANGSGAFTSGTIDIDDPSLGGAYRTTNTLTRVPVTGNYNITADGRGSGAINFSISGNEVQFGLDFVLTSGSHGLITRFDGDGSGSGTLDLQTAIAQSSLAGSYAFGLNGTDSSMVNPLSAVGAITLDANGNVTSGLGDFNDNGNSAGLQSLTLHGTVGAGLPGTAQLMTSTGFGTLLFDVWTIDSTHLKLIETDSASYLEGDALLSGGQTTFPSGPLVFTLSGEDTTQGSFAAGGLLTSNGEGAITAGLEDVNDEGYVGEAPNVSGTYTTTGARTVMTLNGIYNGLFQNDSLATGNYTFAAYPFQGGAMLLEIDNGGGSSFGISGGTLYVQSATSFTASQGYGLNLSGSNGNGEVDTIAEFTATANAMTGLYDANNSGMLVSDANLGAGSYSIASNGRGTASFPDLQITGNSMIGSLKYTFYVVDASTAVFLETDAGQLSLGAFELQNAGQASTVPAARQTGVRPGPFSEVHLKRFVRVSDGLPPA